MELPGAAAGAADDGVMAAGMGLPARPDRARADHAMEQSEGKQRADVAIDGNEVDARSATEELAVQLPRAERSSL